MTNRQNKKNHFREQEAQQELLTLDEDKDFYEKIDKILKKYV